MHQPAKHSEIENIIGYLQQQIDALRTAAHGLTDEEARLSPCASTLSIGGLVKHATYVCNGWEHREAVARGEASGELDEAAFAEFFGSFALTAEETLAGALRAFDSAAWSYLAAIAKVDPDAVIMEPPAPWAGRFEPTETTARFAMLHGVEELARHAGHADIIREQIDGAKAGSLLAAVEGRPANDFVTPWQRSA
ncbi:DinB family protein [Nocardioides sp.]|uniref:DinB family protein n=1 Tax=Nocardioides sp. TaxID=35761 RepID=UPI003D14E0E8